MRLRREGQNGRISGALIMIARTGCWKYAVGCVIFAGIAVGLEIRANAQEGLECVYYYTDEDGNRTYTTAPCDEDGLPHLRILH